MPDELLEPDIDSEALQAAIGSLGDEFRIVVLMFYFEHCSYRKIAEALDIPLGTVMSRLARAKGYLRRSLGEFSQRQNHAAESPNKPALFEEVTSLQPGPFPETDTALDQATPPQKTDNPFLALHRPTVIRQ